MNTWYSKETKYQGLVIDEQTGANIAVTYDPKDAEKIATLYNSVDSLITTLHFLVTAVEVETGKLYMSHLYEANRLLDILKEIKGEENG